MVEIKGNQIVIIPRNIEDLQLKNVT